MTYLYDPLYQLDPTLKGLTLVQVNPHMAVDLRIESENQGWLYQKVEDKWEQVRKLSEIEVAEAWDQSSDFAVLDASQLKG